MKIDSNYGFFQGVASQIGKKDDPPANGNFSALFEKASDDLKKVEPKNQTPVDKNFSALFEKAIEDTKKMKLEPQARPRVENTNVLELNKVFSFLKNPIPEPTKEQMDKFTISWDKLVNSPLGLREIDHLG